MARWVLGGVVCLIVAGYFFYRYFVGVPPLDNLAKLSGDVTSAEVQIRQSRRSSSKLLAVRIGDSAPAFYLERFPDFERVITGIRPGDRVTAWVDVGKDNYIWQLEKGGERLVSYEQVAETQWSNLRNQALFGILFLVVGIGILIAMAVQWKQAAAGRASDPKPSDSNE